MSYSAAVIGCGRVGCSFDDDPTRGYTSTHAGAYAASPDVDLVALVDMDREKLVRYGDKWDVPGRYTDYREMLEKEKPDIISVCTWNDTHLEIVRAAVEAGARAVFCEKPVADSLEAADEMVKVCTEAGVLLIVDHMRRFDPFHQEIAGYVREGKLGRIQQVTCYYVAGAANSGSHLFDLLRFYLGDVNWVEAVYSHNSSPNRDDPNIDGRLGFEDELVAVIQACDVSAYMMFEVSLLGTEGRLRVMRNGFHAEFEKAADSTRFAGYKELHPTDLPFPADARHEFMLFGVAHIVDCLETGRAPVSTGEDGRAALEIISAVRASAAAGGQRVSLPLTGSTITVKSR